MPKSKIFLPDVNVWLAAAAERHAHHRIARRWFESEEAAGGDLAFCRTTQSGLLRLVTHPRVMGDEVLTQVAAWDLYRELESGARTHFLDEPPGLEPKWESFCRLPLPAHALWTDGYLEALATLWGATMVTLDRGFVTRGRVAAVLLGGARTD